MERFHGRQVVIQWPFFRRQLAAVKCHGAGLASQITPIRINRIKIRIIIGVHVQADRLLAHVAVAFDRDRFHLRTRQGRQQQTGQNRDDGDDHEKFDQGEGRLFQQSPFHRVHSRMIYCLSEVNPEPARSGFSGPHAPGIFQGRPDLRPRPRYAARRLRRFTVGPSDAREFSRVVLSVRH